jgi:hypothetical protein
VFIASKHLVSVAKEFSVVSLTMSNSKKVEYTISKWRIQGVHLDEMYKSM